MESLFSSVNLRQNEVMPNHATGATGGTIALVHGSLWARVLLAPLIATVWFSIAALWALMQGKRDTATYKTLAFGFLVVTAVLYVIELTYPRLASVLGMVLETGFIVFSMWWFRRRLKSGKG